MTLGFSILFLAAVTINPTVEHTGVHQHLRACLDSAVHKPFNDEPCLDLIAELNSQNPANTGLDSQPFDQNQRSADEFDPGTTDNSMARAHATLAAGYAAAGNLVTADQHLDTALRLANNDWHTLANAGVVHLYNTRFVDAVTALNQAMSFNPDFPPYLLLNRSLALRGLGRFPESARDVSDYWYLTGQISAVEDPCDPVFEDCKRVPDAAPHQVQ